MFYQFGFDNHCYYWLQGTCRDLRVLCDASTQRQRDVGQVGSGVGQTLGAAVCRAAAHRLGGLGPRAPAPPYPELRNLLRVTAKTHMVQLISHSKKLWVGWIAASIWCFCVPFWEVAGNNIRFKCNQVVQVNIFRALVLAPLAHTFF